MKIKTAEFVKSSKEMAQCPPPDKAEFAFIGRSNVGKSSLINMICGQNDLAKTSSTPGKTQLINHFIINNEWYLVDLPGYGYAKISKDKREEFEKMIAGYITLRKNLINLFVLIDCRHKPQVIDLEFMDWLGENQIAFSIIFTKADKLKKTELKRTIEAYKTKLLESWEELPPTFISSVATKAGKEEILAYIEENKGILK
ncbi:MAG: ribosome biogenesis GTP-binding protein YihA/YsxC [Bacteroidia bacterium]